jgi:hypothetical protein
LALATALCVQILVFGPGRARAEDLSVRRAAWNGLSQLLAIARTGGEVLTPSQIDASALQPTDVLLVIHPVAPLPVAELARFLRKGGRLALADDFGTGGGTGAQLFAAFGMGMHAPKSVNPHRLRNNPELLIASPVVGHLLADGADALVTNHPQVIYHPDLTPIFALDGNQNAIVLSGAVGKGRLVAISDASLFINNMLEFRGNRAFARNLLRFLRGPQSTHLYLLGSDTQWLSGFRQMTTGNPLARVSAMLTRLAAPRLPPLAVLAISIVLAAVLLAAAATALPRRSAYARRAYLRTPDCMAGMVGRVSYHATTNRNCLGPLLVLKLELEHRLVARLHLQSQPQREQVLRELLASGFSAAGVREVADFMLTVDRLQDASLGTETHVPARHFSELVAKGRRILAELDAASQPSHERHE